MKWLKLLLVWRWPQMYAEAQRKKRARELEEGPGRRSSDADMQAMFDRLKRQK